MSNIEQNTIRRIDVFLSSYDWRLENFPTVFVSQAEHEKMEMLKQVKEFLTDHKNLDFVQNTAIPMLEKSMKWAIGQRRENPNCYDLDHAAGSWGQDLAIYEVLLSVIHKKIKPRLK